MNDALPPIGLSVKEAAAYVGISERKARELIQRGPQHGGWPSVKIDGRRIVHRKALDTWFDERCNASQDDKEAA